MNLRAVLCCILVLASIPGRADEQMRRVQEELRKRNLYFGDVDGRQTAETRGAIRRFQERKGFAATGELNADTLRSMDIVPSGKLEESWPDGPVMKSDFARQLAETDRKMLEELQATETAPSPDASAPEAPIAETVGSPGASAGEADPAVKPPTPIALGPNPNPPEEVVEQTKAFVRDYLAACATNRLDAEMQFYADRVSYFDHGNVDRAFVAKDVQRFYKRWPDRHYDLLDFKVTRTRGEERDVSFRIAFRYKNPEQSVAGRSLNFFKVRQEPEGLRFVSLREQRVRE